jgi:hypothetical protein
LVSVRVLSAPSDLVVVVELRVPGGGATDVGTVVVIVCDVVDCAAATPVIRLSTAAPASKNFVILCLSGEQIAGPSAAASLSIGGTPVRKDFAAAVVTCDSAAASRLHSSGVRHVATIVEG